MYTPLPPQRLNDLNVSIALKKPYINRFVPFDANLTQFVGNPDIISVSCSRRPVSVTDLQQLPVPAVLHVPHTLARGGRPDHHQSEQPRGQLRHEGGSPDRQAGQADGRGQVQGQMYERLPVSGQQ